MSSDKDIHLLSKLQKIENSVTQEIRKESPTLNGNIFQCKYLLDNWVNDHEKDTELYLFYLKLDTNQLIHIFKMMEDWWGKFNSFSPKMSEEDLKRIWKIANESR